ncbi:MAG: YlxM family DNA-binding protein [Acutalibacteraceae bacterium]
MLNKDLNVAMLLDIYGKLLTPSQKECLDYYYNQDFSLSEIADNVGKTRQGVFDSIKRAEAILKDVDQKLEFSQRRKNLRNRVLSLKKLLEEMSRNDVSQRKESNLQKSLDIVNQILLEE